MDHPTMNQFREKWAGREKTENMLRDNMNLQRAYHDKAIQYLVSIPRKQHLVESVLEVLS